MCEICFFNYLAPRLVPSIRFLLSVCLFFGVGVQYMQKIDMGLGIVCMVNNTALKAIKLQEDPNFFSDANETNSTCMFQPHHGNKTVINNIGFLVLIFCCCLIASLARTDRLCGRRASKGSFSLPISMVTY